MRHIAIAAMTLTLTACGEGSSFDESFKTSYREKAVSACASQSQASVPPGMNIDTTKLCGCIADKFMAGKSAKDLATTTPNATEGMALAKTCFGELYPNALK